ncbi:MAG: DJ-1/PfpI family protein [Oscillospiraceae bacterium]|jgi:4-methyl-5(b-hydroxyethyl)-thiazole monophosphate biosynthesis|nr:DJ-1/PfpI family protein [Oscillospiraceae bacterium]
MIYVLLANGFEEIEALAPVDLLRRAEKQVLIAGVGGKEISSTRGVKIITDIEVSEIELSENLEMIVLPGGLPGKDNLETSEKVIEAIKYCAGNNVFIASICAAPSIIGKMGLLSGKRATCYNGFEKFLEGAEILDDAVVADGKFITGKGAGSSIEFALKLVEVLCGAESAEKMSKTLQCS